MQRVTTEGAPPEGRLRQVGVQSRRGLHPQAYLAFDALLALVGQGPAGPGEAGEHCSLERLWSAYQEGRLSLVAEGGETEIDIILWLNRRGCCVFDTLMVMEALEEFERWGRADPGETDRFKRLYDVYEQLELFFSRKPAAGRAGGLRAAEMVRSGLFDGPDGVPAVDGQGSWAGLLRRCLMTLHERYSAEQWSDLRSVDYALNWEIIGPHLAGEGLMPALGGATHREVREVFGLFCRAVALSKKSCPTPRMTESHVDFVIATVLKKYRYNKGERYALHLLLCAEQGIPYFVTVDADLLAAAAANPHVPAKQDGPMPHIIRPSAFESLL